MSTFNVAGPVRLDIRVPHADVDVSTGPAGTATVTLSANGKDSAEADDQARVTCERRGDADVLTISSNQRGIFRHRRPLGISVRVPEGSDATITTAAGAIVCGGSLGAVRVETASAGVRVPAASAVDVVGVSGEVQVGTVAGAASVKTVSGAIEVEDVRGRLVLRTVSGRMRVRRAGSDVEARSVSGDVALQRLESGIVRLDSVSGDALFGVQPGVAVWLDLDSASGDVRSELGASNDGPADGKPVLELRGRTVTGNVRVISTEV
jgi:DUF4097 and DUF4098 domain-containing protein YvlB